MRVDVPDVRAALFDFDETIIDLEAQHLAASEALCRDFGAQLPSSLLGASGTRLIDEVRRLREHFGWNESEDELLARRQRHFDAICRSSALEPMPGVREVVHALRERGLPLAITTSAARDAIETILARIGLRDAFALIVDGSEVQRGKPDPEAFLLTAHRLGVAPADCVVFEDSEVGVLAAKRAGMYCIAVRNPRAATFQNLAAADTVVDSFLRLLR